MESKNEIKFQIKESNLQSKRWTIYDSRLVRIVSFSFLLNFKSSIFNLIEIEFRTRFPALFRSLFRFTNHSIRLDQRPSFDRELIMTFIVIKILFVSD